MNTVTKSYKKLTHLDLYGPVYFFIAICAGAAGAAGFLLWDALAGFEITSVVCS